MQELRCDNRILFGRLDSDGSRQVLEVACRSRRCGYEAGVVVIHRFDLVTGDLMGTKRFRNPTRKEAEGEHVSSLRSA